MAHALSVDDPLPHTEVAEEPPATAPGGGQWATALVAEAVAARPVEEVVQLLALLHPHPDSAPDPAVCAMVASRPPADLAVVLRTLRATRPAAAERILRAAATAKPLPELADLLGLVADDRTEADAALRTVATQRPVDDVVRLAQLLRATDRPAEGASAPPAPEGTDPPGHPRPAARAEGAARSPHARRAERADRTSRADRADRGDPLGWAAFGLLVVALAVQLPLLIGHWAHSTALSATAAVGAGLVLLLYGWLAPRAALSAVLVGSLALAAVVGDALLLLGVLPHTAQLSAHASIPAFTGMAAALGALLLSSVRLLSSRRA